MKQRLFLAIVMLMTFCSFCRADLNDYTVYDSDSKTLTFYCDGHKGDWQAQAGCDVYDLPYDPRTYNDIDWAREHGEDITTVVFDESFARTKPTSTRFWFVILENLTSIVNIENLNTSEVTDMSYMFAYCEKMQSIDVTHFNTSKVKDMIGMFDGCSSLKTLDLTNWDTSNVEYMGSIFSGCEELTRITSLENLDLSKVISMTRMFEGCQKLKILNLTGWDTSNVTNMSGMFWNCTNLKKIFVGDNWNTEKVTSSNYMFAYCNNLVGGEGTAYSYEHIDASYACIDGGPDSETPGYLSARPSGYAVYTSSNQTFTFYNDGKMDEKTGDNMYLLPIEEETPGWFNNSNKKKVTTVVFHESFASAFPVSTSDWFNHFEKLTTIEGIEYLNTDKVTEMSAMFNSCYKLKDLDLSTFNTSNVTNMLMMFCGCSQLTELDLCNFDTSNVTSMLLMFSGCSLLTELDLRSFDTHNVKQMDMMFQNCTNLVTIYANDDKWNTDNVETGGGMFYYCTSLVGGNGTRWSSDYGQWSNQSSVLYARIDGGPDNPGYLTSKLGAYAVYDSDSQTLTFYYDDQKETYGDNAYYMNEENVCPGWIDYSNPGTIQKVVFTSSFQNARPTSTYDWFYNQPSLTEIVGIKYLNTSEVENMDEMFFMCSGLETIALNKFDTGNVKTMRLMFGGCSSLTTLDLSSFNTTNVTDMSFMFDGCSGLTTLNLRNFDTSNVINMQSMFYGCTKLKTITVGLDWSTQNVTESGDMFSGCTSIKGGAGTEYNPGITDKAYAHADGLGGPGYLTAVSYGITVSGKAVTFANKYDVLGNETVYYDDSNNTLTLNNASLTSINIASSTPKNLRILVWGDCYVKHTASKGDAFITSIASTSIEGNGTLTITSKNGAGINIKRSSTAGLLVKDIDLVVKGNTAGIIGSANSTNTRFYSNLAFENTNCIIGRTGGEQGSVGIINKMVFNKCTMTQGVLENHEVLANPMVIERNVIGITTGIENGQRNSVKGQRDEWYTIDGQKLSGKPTQKGIYIHNGHKRVIK